MKKTLDIFKIKSGHPLNFQDIFFKMAKLVTQYNLVKGLKADLVIHKRILQIHQSYKSGFRQLQILNKKINNPAG